MIRYSKVAWKDIESDVLRADEELHRLLGRINDASSGADETGLVLYKGTFKFGELIIDKGVLNIPGGTDAELKKELQTAFHGTIPLALILKMGVEVFVESDPDGGGTRSIPLNLINQGAMFGVFEAAERLRGKPDTAGWSVSAGARSPVLVAPFDNEKQRKLKKEMQAYEFPDVGKPKKDPWRLFTWMAKYTEDWSVEVLLIPRCWWISEEPQCPEPIARFQRHLLLMAWDQSSYIRIRSEIDLHIQGEIAKQRFNKQSHELHLKQIVAIASGNALGFEVAQASRAPLGPFQSITNLLRKVDDNGHYPLILQPAALPNVRPSGDGTDGQAPTSNLGVFYSASIFRIPGSMAQNERSKPPDSIDFQKDLADRCKNYVPQLLNSLGVRNVSAKLIAKHQVPPILKEIASCSGWDVSEEELSALDENNAYEKSTFFWKCVFIRNEREEQ